MKAIVAPTPPDPIIVAHTAYKQRGGEDQVFEAECSLLERRGHRVERFFLRNEAMDQLGPVRKAQVTLWNFEAAAQLRTLVCATGAKVVHVHNTFPYMSPAVYYAARAAGAAVVQTLHNYRIGCMQGFFYRDGQVCDDCLGRAVQLAGIRHNCYRGSTAASALAAAASAFHRAIGTWRDLPDAYIAVTPFLKDKMILSGLPADRIHVKPHFLASDPGPGEGGGGFVLFSGRLSPEKGIDTLLAAWERHDPGIPLRIAGVGPMEDLVAQAARRCPNVQPLGFVPHDQLMCMVGKADLIVVPTAGYEAFGLVVMEAFAKGTPVVASRLGPLPDMIDHDRTGRLFSPGNAADLASAVSELTSCPIRLRRFRANARAEFEKHFHSDQNYMSLIAVYHQALLRRS